MNRRRFQTVSVLVLVILLLGGMLAASLYTVDEREQVVILQFGRPVDSYRDPGLYFKVPFIQQVRRLPKTKQFWHSTESDALSELLTEGGKKIEVSAWAVWRITDPERFVRVLRTVENAEDAVKVRIRSAIREEVKSYSLSEVVRSSDRELTYSISFERPDTAEKLPGDVVEAEDVMPQQEPFQPGEIESIEVGRQKIMDTVAEKVQQRLQEMDEQETSGRGIELVDMGISNIEFTPAVREAAFERLKTFMESIATGYLKLGELRKQQILNETEAEVQKIVGEGEGESNTIRGEVDAEIIGKYADAINKTGDFYNFIKTLEVNKEALSGKSRLILTTDSELFRMLKQVEPVSAPPPTELTGDGSP